MGIGAKTRQISKLRSSSHPHGQPRVDPDAGSHPAVSRIEGRSAARHAASAWLRGWPFCGLPALPLRSFVLIAAATVAAAATIHRGSCHGQAWHGGGWQGANRVCVAPVSHPLLRAHGQGAARPSSLLAARRSLVAPGLVPTLHIPLTRWRTSGELTAAARPFPSRPPSPPTLRTPRPPPVRARVCSDGEFRAPHTRSSCKEVARFVVLCRPFCVVSTVKTSLVRWGGQGIRYDVAPCDRHATPAASGALKRASGRS